MGCLNDNPYATRLEAIYEDGNVEHKAFLNSLKLSCKEKNLSLKYKFMASKSSGFNLTLYHNGQTHIIEERFDGTEASLLYNVNLIERILNSN